MRTRRLLRPLLAVIAAALLVWALGGCLDLTPFPFDAGACDADAGACASDGGAGGANG
jgi:hypothetical protein